MGGLDIVSVKHKTQAMLAEWWVKWLIDRKSSWHEIVRNKYNCQPNHSLRDALTGKNVSPVVRGIINISNDKGFNLTLELNQFYWIIRDGRSVLFWKDCWSDEGVLSVKFPRLFSLSKLRLILVRDYYDYWSNPSTEI